METKPRTKNIQSLAGIGRRILGRAEVEKAVRGSASIYEACARLGVQNSAVYRAMKRFGITKPAAWSDRHRFMIGRFRRLRPLAVLTSKTNRQFIGILIGTEGAIMVKFDKPTNNTGLIISISMTDRTWVARFTSLCGVGPPRLSRSSYQNHSDVWSKTIIGLRALMVLREVLPYLLGEKRLEALRAIEFFSPTGYRRGHFSARDIWLPSDFPLRRKGPSSAQALGRQRSE